MGPQASWIVKFEQKNCLGSDNADVNDAARSLTTEAPIASQTDTGHAGRELWFSISV